MNAKTKSIIVLGIAGFCCCVAVYNLVYPIQFGMEKSIFSTFFLGVATIFYVISMGILIYEQ